MFPPLHSVSPHFCPTEATPAILAASYSANTVGYPANRPPRAEKSFLQAVHCALPFPMQRHRIRFTPVRLKVRHDGWTAARQIRFIEELAATKSIVRACQAVGMSRMSAYKLRDHPDAGQFRLAWTKALEPHFARERRRSPRALHRLRRLEDRRKVYKADETDGPPDSNVKSASTLSPLPTLETLLAMLRSREDALGSARGD